jgi:hypothetical protein
LGQHLFDGLTLTDWRAHSGAWRVSRNSEGGRVLSGTSGSIYHALVNQSAKKRMALPRFRLSVVVQLHGATSAEIEFGREISVDDGPRYVAQLSANAVCICRRENEAARCTIGSPTLSLDRGSAEPYTLMIERQPNVWRVLLDEKLVGTVPVSSEPTAATFSLRAEEGEAWFSDVIIQSLGEPQAESAP